MQKVLLFLQLIIIIILTYLSGFSLQRKETNNEILRKRNENLTATVQKLEIENRELVLKNEAFVEKIKYLEENNLALNEDKNEMKVKSLMEKDKLSLIELRLENLQVKSCKPIADSYQVLENKYNFLLSNISRLIKEKKIQKSDFVKK